MRCLRFALFDDNEGMRLISVFRDGDQMCAMVGPDWVMGLAGFGETVSEALRDLATGFAKHGYQLRANRVGVEVVGEVIEEVLGPGRAPADALQSLADTLERAGYTVADFPEPDWVRIGREERLLPAGHDRN